MVQTDGSSAFGSNQDPKPCEKVPLQETKGREEIAHTHGAKIWPQKVSADALIGKQKERNTVSQVL